LVYFRLEKFKINCFYGKPSMKFFFYKGFKPLLLPAIFFNPITMKINAWKMIPKAGNIKNLQLVNENIEDPLPGEVQISVKAIGLNFADIFAMYGLYGATPTGAFVPGLEYAGTIEKVGEKVIRYKVGDRIMGVTRFGGYASALNVQEEYVTMLPSDWNFEEGAAFLVQVLTAYWALIELANMKKGETILIHSAAGGVGLWANRIAKNLGGYTIGSIGNESKADILKAEGYDDYIVRSKSFGSDLRDKLNGRPLDIVLESIGGRIFTESYVNMALMGRMVVYGSARYAQTGTKPAYLKLILQYLARPKIDPQKMIEQNKAILGFNLIYLYERKDKLAEALEGLMEFELGKPIVGHIFSFRDIKNGIKLFQSGKTIGKVVVTVD
jgi:alcohol dehydrogenase